MAQRKYLDCREYPGSTCSLRISGTEDEVLNTGVQHAVLVHQEKDTSEFREKLRSILKDDAEGVKVARQVA